MYVTGSSNYNDTTTDLSRENRLASITILIGNRFNPSSKVPPLKYKTNAHNMSGVRS